MNARVKLSNGEFHHRHFDHTRLRHVGSDDNGVLPSVDSDSEDWIPYSASIDPPTVETSSRRTTRTRRPPD